jgi:hypothetical protein
MEFPIDDQAGASQLQVTAITSRECAMHHTSNIPFFQVSAESQLFPHQRKQTHSSTMATAVGLLSFFSVVFIRAMVMIAKAQIRWVVVVTPVVFVTTFKVKGRGVRQRVDGIWIDTALPLALFIHK